MRHIIVGGAGIGGLAAAIAIARGGDRVTVLERRPALAAFGAGVQLSPNATGVLARLGLLDVVRACAIEPASARIRRARDGAELLRLPLADTAARTGAPFLLLHRADLQHELAAAAAASGAVTVRTGADITRPNIGRNGVAVTGGDHHAPITGDGFVDARGVHARLDFGAASPRLMAWRALVPAEAVPAAYTEPTSNLWLGPGAHLVHYPLRGGTVINVVAVTPRSRPPAPDGEPWSEQADPAVLRQYLRGWHRDATRLVAGAVAWRSWPLFEAPPLARWGDGPCTRLGDAAHPMLPFLAQGASQTIEDAGALAAALNEGADVAAAFRRYERRRAPRAARVVQASRRQGELYHMSRPASDGRDLVMRALGGRRSLARMDWLYGPG